MKKDRDLLDIVSKNNELYEMANLWPNDTGLPIVIWVQEKGYNRHGPRIKVMAKKGKMNIEQTISMTIEDEPKVVGGQLSNEYYRVVSKWIRKNKENLILYWKQKISSVELFKRLKKVK